MLAHENPLNTGNQVEMSSRNKNPIWKSMHIAGVPEEMGADEVAQGEIKKRAKNPVWGR